MYAYIGLSLKMWHLTDIIHASLNIVMAIFVCINLNYIIYYIIILIKITLIQIHTDIEDTLKIILYMVFVSLNFS